MFKKLILTILCLLGAGLAGRGIAASESGAAAVSGQQPPATINPQAQISGAVHTAGMDAPCPELA